MSARENVRIHKSGRQKAKKLIKGESGHKQFDPGLLPEERKSENDSEINNFLLDETRNKICIERLPKPTFAENTSIDLDEDNENQLPTFTYVDSNDSCYIPRIEGDETDMSSSDEDKQSKISNFKIEATNEKTETNVTANHILCSELMEPEEEEEKINLVQNKLVPSPGAPMIKTKVKVNGISAYLFATIDSGADRTCITDKYLDTYFPKLRVHEALKIRPGIKLSAAGNNPLMVLGTIQMWIRISSKIIRHEVIVIKSSSKDFLLGVDLLKNNFILNGSKLQIQGDPKGDYVPIYYRKERYPVRTAGIFSLRPNEEKCVEVRLELDEYKSTSNREMLFVPEENISTNMLEIQMVPTATIVDHLGKCTIRVCNKTNEMVSLEKNRFVGYVYHTSAYGDQILTLEELKYDPDWIRNCLKKEMPEYILKKGAYAEFLNEQDLKSLRKKTSTCTSSSVSYNDLNILRGADHIKLASEHEINDTMDQHEFVNINPEIKASEDCSDEFKFDENTSIKVCIEKEDLEPLLDEEGFLEFNKVQNILQICTDYENSREIENDYVLKIQDINDRKEILDGLESPHFIEPAGDEPLEDIKEENWMDGLDVSHIPTHRIQRVKDMVKNHEKAFVRHKYDTSRFKYFMVNIPMKKGATPVQQKYRPIPMRYQDLAQQTIDDLLLTGKISPSTSNYASNLCIAKRTLMVDGKPEVKHRLCFDSREANTHLKECKHPNISMPEAFAKISNAKYKTMMDVASAFQNLLIAPNQRHRLAFYGPGHRLYEYNVLPYGLNLSLSAWLIAINCVTAGLHNVIAFVDDLSVFSHAPHDKATEDECFEHHMQYVEVLLKRLIHAGIKIKLSKCRFALGKDDVTTWLGHTLTSLYMKPDKAKIEAILNFPIPTTPRQALSFISLVGWYRAYIEAFCVYAAVIYKAINADDFDFNRDCVRVFNLLKKKICEEPVLTTVQPNQPFKLYVDASANCIAAILEQDQPGLKKSKAIAYASRQLNKQELNLSNPLKELLSIIYALTTWSNIIYGHETTIYTDARCWVFLKLTSASSSRMSRLGLFFAEFPNLKICHIKGAQNKAADALSRAYMETYEVKIEDPKLLKDPRLNDLGCPKTDKPVKLEKYLTKCEKYLETNWPPKSVPTKKSQVETINQAKLLDEMLENYAFNSERENERIHIISNQVKCGKSKYDAYKIDCSNESDLEDVNPRISLELSEDEPSRLLMVTLNQTCFTPEAFAAMQRNDEKLCPIINRLRRKTNESHEVDGYVLSKGILMYNAVDKQGNKHLAVVVPIMLKDIILKYYHDHMANRGYGSARMEATIRKLYDWKSIRKDVRRICNTCIICAYNQRYTKGTPLGNVITPSFPNHVVYMDLVESLPRSYDGMTSALAIYDNFSRFVHCIPLKNTKAEYVAQQFAQQYLQWSGVPMYLVSDQGKNVCGSTINYICTMLGVRKVETAAYSARQDLAEKACDVIGDTLRKRLSESDRKYWSLIVGYLIAGYNYSVSPSTDASPAEIFLGRQTQQNLIPQIPGNAPALERDEYLATMHRGLQYKYEIIKKQIQSEQNKRKQRINTRRFSHGYMENDYVMVKDQKPVLGKGIKKLNNRFEGPYLVIRAFPSTLLC